MHESTALLLLPDVLLPEQYFSRPLPQALSPERRLMLAVLEEAVLTLMRHRADSRMRRRRLAHEAELWIMERNASWPFAFENICAALRLDPDYLRRGLLQLVQRPDALRNERGGVVPLPFARRVAGQRHKVGLILSHRKVAD
jgi:hypothetical protein